MTTINIFNQDNFTDEEAKKLRKACMLLEAAINSDVFRNRVTNFTYNGKKQFNWNEGKTNEEILEIILLGIEERNGGKDEKWDMSLEISPRCPKTSIGVTINQKHTITYRCKLADMEPGEYAGHLAHEYCHYLGFSHSENYTPTRKYTVPYAIGYMLAEICGIINLEVTPEELQQLHSIAAAVETTYLQVAN
jgi:hypothetical protein